MDLRTKLLIGGEWVDGSDRFATVNPATEEVIAEVEEAGAAELLAEDVAPIDDVRSTAAYRLAVSRALLRDFLQAPPCGSCLQEYCLPTVHCWDRWPGQPAFLRGG